MTEAAAVEEEEEEEQEQEQEPEQEQEQEQEQEVMMVVRAVMICRQGLTLPGLRLDWRLWR